MNCEDVTRCNWCDGLTSAPWQPPNSQIAKTLVCDNLNTHVTGAFYDAFEAHEARTLLNRLEIRHTPKHGSWLNVAENELSSMTRQSLHGQRFATIKALQSQVKAWAKATNKKQRAVDWRFSVDDTRQKTKTALPQNQIWVKH